jgi:peptide/nickel transport system permease protein
MTTRYLLGRIGFFFAIIWVTATINFVIPRIAPGDPIEDTVARLTATGQSTEGADKLIAAYRERLGLDDPLIVQYLRYLKSVVTLDFGYSAALFPVKVNTLIGDALPWSIGLLTIATLLAFAIGTLLGALLAWPSMPRMSRVVLTPLMMLSAVPYYLLAIALSFLIAFRTGWLPATGGTSAGVTPGLDWASAVNVVEHGTLPALSIVLSAIGFWMLGMRGMMITTLGSDHMLLAEAKGLPRRNLFWRHGVRTAILPQVTALALALGEVVSGAVLVEVIFGYPGIGGLFYQAIRSNDYPLIQGISIVLATSIALSILIVDLVYPFLDPRISYRRR